MKTVEKKSEAPARELHQAHRREQQQRLRRLSATETERALATRTSVADVIVVTQDAAAVVPWRQRYEKMLEANQRLHERLDALQSSHRKCVARWFTSVNVFTDLMMFDLNSRALSITLARCAFVRAMTTVKYEPALPNNDVFTKQLVEENRLLLTRTRELELRLFGVRRCRSFKWIKSHLSASTAAVTGVRTVQIDGRPATASPSPARSRTPAASSKSHLKAPPHRSATVKHSSAQTDPISESHPDQAMESVPPKLSGLLTALKTRLSELELDLDRLRQENELLRRDLTDHHGGKNRPPNATTVEEKDEDGEFTLRELKEREELQCALQDRVRQMGLLEARYDQLTERVRERAALYEQSLSHIEQLNEQLFSAQQQLAEQTQTIQQHDDLALENDALKKEAHLLRSETAKLNEAISTLSSRPFDAMSLDLQTKNLWIAKLEETEKALQSQVVHAQQDVRVAKQTNAQLNARVKKLQMEIERQTESLEQCRLECEHHKMAQEIAELQLRFYTSPDDKLLLRALGKAIKDMRLEDNSAVKLTSFMESVGTHERETNSAPMCAKCYASLSQGNSLQRQRLAKVSELTALLKEDSQAQIASLKLHHAQQMQVLRRTACKWEKRANEYLEEIRTLQREKSEGRRIPVTRSFPLTADPCAAITRTQPSHSQHQHQQSSNADENHSNIIEIVLSELQLTNLSTPAGHPASLVLLCDYFDFESQISPVISVSSDSNGGPIDFGITYKTYQDASFFRSPGARQVHIELHQLRVGCMELVGVCNADLNSLFLSSDGYRADRHKLANPFTQATIGNLKIELSLGHPVDVFYKSVLHDSSRSLLKPSSLGTGPSSVSTSFTKGSVTIRVLSLLLMKNFVADVKSATNKTETHLELSYRFIGFPTASILITLPSIPSIGGYFVVPTRGSRSFEVDTSTDFVRFLERYTLELQIQSKSGDRCYGQASVPFHELLKQISCTPASSGFVFASFHDTTWAGGERRLLGRACLQIELRGLPSKVKAPQFLPVTAPHVVAAIKSHFSSASSEKTGEEVLRLNWAKFRDVMNLSPLDMALRHIMNAKKSSTQDLRCLVARLNSYQHRLSSPGEDDQSHLQNPFETLESFSALIRDGGIQLTPTELAMLLSGLLHATRVTGERLPSVLLQTMIARKLKLLCETCDDEWLAIEGSLRQRALTLDSLKVDNASKIDGSTQSGSSKSSIVSLSTFQERLGLFST